MSNDWTAYDAAALREFRGGLEDMLDVFVAADKASRIVWLTVDQEVCDALEQVGMAGHMDDIISEIRGQIMLVNDALTETDEARAERDADREAQEIGPI